MKKGSITLGIIAGIGVPLFLAGTGWLLSLTSKNEADIKEVRNELKYKGEEISAIKEAMSTVKEDNREIKADIKELLRRIK